MSQTYEIVHILPGRVRIRLGDLYHQPQLAAGLEHCLNLEQGVHCVSANSNASCVTVTFDEGQFVPDSWFSVLDWDHVAKTHKKHLKHVGLVSKHSPLRRVILQLDARYHPKAQFGVSILALSLSWLGFPAFIARAALLAATVPVLGRAAQAMFDEAKVSADALDGTSLLVLIWRGSFAPAGIMLTLISLGELMRDQVTSSCQRLFADQLSLGRESAWLINGKRRVRVPVHQLRSNDKVVVYSGELIGVNGTVYSGEATVVPATPEMDFEPQTIKSGDRVRPGMIVTDGKLYIQSELIEICNLPDPITAKQTKRWMQRTKLHKQALRRAHSAVLPMLSAATLLFVLTKDIHRAIAFVCFDFITGIKIAIPTAMLSSMFKAGRRGIVIRNATSMEKLAEVDTILFARGGALTSLKPVVTEIHVSEGFTMNQVTRLAAAVVQRFNHLGACAIYQYAHINKIPVPERAASNAFNGLGVQAEVEGHDVMVGSTSLMRKHHIDLSSAKEFLDLSQTRGDTRACVVIDGKLAGVIAFQDPVRSEAKAVVCALKAMGINELAVMSSGNQAAAQHVADQTGISNVHYRTLPEDQAAIVHNYKRAGRRVAVVGYDAANTLALEQADVAVSLDTGTDITKHRADVVLTSDNLEGLVEGIRIAREGMGLARQNLTLTSVPNLCGLILSAVGRGEYLAAALINNGSVIVGAANGLRPLLDTPDEDPEIVELSGSGGNGSGNVRGNESC